MSLRFPTGAFSAVRKRMLIPALIFAIGWTSAAIPQVSTPSSEQLELLQGLGSDQQRLLLDQLGTGMGGLGTGTTAAGRQLADLEDRGDSADRLKSLLPRLEGEDSVVVEVRIRRFVKDISQPANPQSTAAALSSGLNAPTTYPQMPQAAPAAAPAAPLPPEPIERTEQEEARLAALVQRIADGSPYRLDRTGAITLPEMTPIPLFGLTEEQAKQRLETEPALLDLEFRVTLLSRDGNLKPFGYELFESRRYSFAADTNFPVPADYVLGPGDALDVRLFGNPSRSYSLTVTRDGTISIPQVGQITVAGLGMDAARQRIASATAAQMMGARVGVTLGKLRSIRVFVLGDVKRPGSYTVGGLSTMTNALLASGGLRPIGSLRHVQLKRSGRLIQELDLYDLLLRGDTHADARLQAGDVIFVPPVTRTVSVVGEIRRPAIYELDREQTVAELVALAGGMTAQADPQSATIERIDEQHERTVATVDLLSEAGRAERLRTGDLLRLRSVRPLVTSAVTLAGHVYRPGSHQFRPGMRLSDVVGSIDDLRPDGDQHYVLIRREDPATHRVSVVSADLAAALGRRGSAADVPLADRDQIHVFDLQASRDRVIAPIIEELKRQADRDQPTQIVGIGGRSKVGGQYPLEPGMRVADLIRAGGGLDEAAYGTEAELIRSEVADGQLRRTELIRIDVQQALAGEPAANVALMPFDYLVIKETPLWSRSEQVTVEGEVRFPGTYPIRRGETMKSVIERAGGLTELAFTEGSVFTRKDLQEREQKQLETLTGRLKRDLATLALQNVQSAPQVAGQVAGATSIGQSLLEELKGAKAVGRLVIELPTVLAATPGSAEDVLLKDGDRLLIPRKTQEVTVIGEVQSATSHLYDPADGVNDYIDASGGVTHQADRNGVYVIRANGSIVTAGGGRWFARHGTDVRPGDTIVVPLDAGRMRPLPVWQAVTTIIYNLAVAVAAVNSF
jgi:protein involved in polysaccharide export with SLBB domain